MNKPTLICIHGGQGCGKTTITNQLREQQLHSTLIRLAGVPSMGEKANSRALAYHLSMLKGVKGSASTGMNFIFDRSFLCEKVYANLGYKPHDFKKETQLLKYYLEILANFYDIHFVLLTAKKETLEQRLKREGKPNFEQVVFDANNSLKQQEAYMEEFKHLPSAIKTQIIATDELEAAEIVEQILKTIKGD